MADHHMEGASQGGQGPENNILQQILDKIQEQSLEITALKRAQNTPADQILDKIQEQSMKIAALEQAQKTPELTRNPSPNPAIHAGPSEPRRRVGQVNSSKVGKEEVNTANSDVDSELESGKE